MIGLSKLLSQTTSPTARNTFKIIRLYSLTTQTASSLTKNLLITNQCNKNLLLTQIRASHGRTLPIRPSKFNTKIVVDILHYHIFVALAPVLALVIYVNIVYGPATLTEIPEGYEPRQWEYHRHPISQFLKRNFFMTEERAYEVTLHNLYVDDCRIKMRRLENKVKRLMAERNDYKAWYYLPVNKETLEYSKEFEEKAHLHGYTGGSASGKKY